MAVFPLLQDNVIGQEALLEQLSELIFGGAFSEQLVGRNNEFFSLDPGATEVSQLFAIMRAATGAQGENTSRHRSRRMMLSAASATTSQPSANHDVSFITLESLPTSLQQEWQQSADRLDGSPAASSGALGLGAVYTVSVPAGRADGIIQDTLYQSKALFGPVPFAMPLDSPLVVQLGDSKVAVEVKPVTGSRNPGSNPATQDRTDGSNNGFDSHVPPASDVPSPAAASASSNKVTSIPRTAADTQVPTSNPTSKNGSDGSLSGGMLALAVMLPVVVGVAVIGTVAWKVAALWRRRAAYNFKEAMLIDVHAV